MSATTGSFSDRLVDHRSAAASCRIARSPLELKLHYGVRHAVFVEEQAIFSGDDRDAWDDDPATLHAIGSTGGRTAGAVRLYPLDDQGLWQGDRLAVLADERHSFLGAELVRFAVATAGGLGGARMNAMIQLPNVRFFELLGWSVAGPVEPYHGVDHQPMSIPLSRPSR